MGPILDHVGRAEDTEAVASGRPRVAAGLNRDARAAAPEEEAECACGALEASRMYAWAAGLACAGPMTRMKRSCNLTDPAAAC